MEMGRALICPGWVGLPSPGWVGGLGPGGSRGHHFLPPALSRGQVPWPIPCRAVVFLPRTEWPTFPERRVRSGACLGPGLCYGRACHQRTQRHSRRLRCLLSLAARTKSPFSLLVVFLFPVFILTFPTSNRLVNNKMKETANIGSSLFVPCI